MDARQLAEYIDLVEVGEALVIDKRTIHGAIPYLESSSLIVFPGSFDPIHQGHRPLARAALVEITKHHFYKGEQDALSLAHRALMINKHGLPVLITNDGAGSYAAKHQLLCDIVDRDYIYRIDVDTWNWCLDPEMLRKGMFGKMMPESAMFEIVRNGSEDRVALCSEVTRCALLIRTAIRPNIHSTHIRKHKDLSKVIPPVAEYILRNKLYDCTPDNSILPDVSQGDWAELPND